ncbi:SHOCT domain-containing protein [Arthrobacter sp. BE255]|uniref:SHOCT domain-containing protein n=1 Tax=Arthrobacter sp. BE255 TaxID=2817721 RepID=UPI0028595B84|nr:SHOCT domain-containing protein [Arthrobacter sp. BE255]MDR7161755.1 hypothetical protein [Arthrobacter sp. BE255]
MSVQTYKLGSGYGSITDNGDGTASYKHFTRMFRVRIADVVGFSVIRAGEVGLQLKILGHGTELAAVLVKRGAYETIEAWFRAHPDFGGNAALAPVPASPQLDGRLVADELVKLVGLRDAGVLTDDEFAAQKARLLG